MSKALFSSLDSLATWRRGLDRGVEQLAQLLTDTGLLDAQAQALAASVRERLSSDRLVLAFVAEFSRGKSELINALFFADTGRRVLPATPGRTTMCPVELAWDGEQPPSLSLLPIATRSATRSGLRNSGQTLAELREQPAMWRQMPLPVGDPEAMALVMQQVMRTLLVPLAEARELGFWSDEHPEDNPPRDAQDRVEVPAWRHALINYPHPLLRRGLVVIDTPGLNAIGAEPELTLALLPTAHAAVFLLAADTGVTRSDLAVWRDHLGDRGCERFVVLNKIDTLADPLLSAEQVENQLQRQCEQVAHTLGVELNRVFPLSARKALAARVQGDDAALVASRLPVLEHALLYELLPQRCEVIGRMVEDGVLALQQAGLRRLDDRQRQLAEQLFELRSLRGKGAGRLKLMASRVDGEAADFERCGPRLMALRAVLTRQMQAVLDGLSGERVRDAVQLMREGSETRFFKLGAARAFALLIEKMQALMSKADALLLETEQMLQASGRQLNIDFGFSLASVSRPALDRFGREVQRIDASYSQYVGVMQIWRLSQSGGMERFSRMLLARLRVVFEGAATDIEVWGKSISTQIDDQLRERRLALQHRREAHERIRTAEGGLERSIHGLEAQESQMLRLSDRLAGEVDNLRRQAVMPPAGDTPARMPTLQLVPPALVSAVRGVA